MNEPITPTPEPLPPPKPRMGRWEITGITAAAVGAAVVALAFPVRMLIDAAGPDLEGTVSADLGSEGAVGASAECSEALDAADTLIAFAIEGLDKGAEAMGVASDAFGAAASFDINGMEDAATEITAISQWFEDNQPKAGALRNSYDTAKAACLG
jgi:hypothetical protein